MGSVLKGSTVGVLPLPIGSRFSSDVDQVMYLDTVCIPIRSQTSVLLYGLMDV